MGFAYQRLKSRIRIEVIGALSLHHLRCAIFFFFLPQHPPLDFYYSLRLEFLFQKETPLIFGGLLKNFLFIIFILKFEILFWKMKPFVLRHPWEFFFFFLPKVEIFLKLIPSILFFGKSLKSFLFIFFYHLFIYFIIHSSFHFIIILKKIIIKNNNFFFGWVAWVNLVKHELTRQLMWGFNEGGPNFWPSFFMFSSSSLFFLTSSLLSFLPPLSLLKSFFLFAFSSFPHHCLLRKLLL